MSKEDASKWYDHVQSNKAARDEMLGMFENVQKIAAKHGYTFDLSEYFDVLHEKSGMTKVGKSSDPNDHPDTCVPFCLSETPRY